MATTKLVTAQIFFLTFDIVSEILILVTNAGMVRAVFATSAFFMTLCATYFIYMKYRTRVRAPVDPHEDEEEAAAARATRRMDIILFICCTGLLAITIIDIVRITQAWSGVMDAFTLCPMTLVVVILIIVFIDAAGDCLGF